MKCPNCAGELYFDSIKKIEICPFCESEFNVVKEEEGINKRSKKTLSKELFELKNIQEISKEAIVSIKMMFRLINEGYEIKEYIYVFEQVAKSNSDIATSSVNKELMDKAVVRINELLCKNEKVLFYKDSGIVSRAKTGILVTNERLYFLHKKGIEVLGLSKIQNITIPRFGSSWDFNDNDLYKLDSIGCNYDCTGVILAFICTMARDKNSLGYKIILKS